jgi:hypothetical protein
MEWSKGIRPTGRVPLSFQGDAESHGNFQQHARNCGNIENHIRDRHNAIQAAANVEGTLMAGAYGLRHFCARGRPWRFRRARSRSPGISPKPNGRPPMKKASRFRQEDRRKRMHHFGVMHARAGNVYRATDPASLAFHADCAKWVYMLRA